MRCWCCLESTSTAAQPLLRCGCACRGSAGWAHVVCLVQAATIHTIDDPGHDLWIECPTCKQTWHGRFQLEMARGHSRRYSDRPEDDSERVFAESHLATVLRHHGKLTEALPMGERVLATCRQFYGPDDPFTIASQQDLAAIHAAMGEYDKALPLEQEALAFHRREYGDEDRSTLMTISSVATTCTEMGNFEAARALCEERLATQRRVRADDGVGLHVATHGLACLYCETGEMTRAVPLFNESLELSRRVFGSAHLTTLEVAGNL